MAGKEFKGIAKDFITAMKTQFIGKGADPNDIFVQDLFNYEPKKPSVSMVAKTNRGLNGLMDLSQEDRQTLDIMLKVFNQHITTKRELLTQARQLFETDIVQTVIDVMIDDGFNSFNNEKEEFRIEYDLDEDDKENLGEDFQDQVQTIIDDFVDKFNLKSRIAEIVPELLRDGEYALGVLFDEENKKGVTDIVDDMDVMNMIPFYEGDSLSFVINQNNYDDKGSSKFDTLGNVNFGSDAPQFYKADNMVFFRLKGPTKKRINMSLFYNNDFRKHFYEKTNIRLPKYVRIPLPIYYSAMKNLNRLKLMEDVSTVLDLSGVLKSEIVTVTVPTNTNPQEAAQIVRDYERQLNDQSALSNSESLDISTLAAQANRRKVLPQWMDTKGTITKSDIGSNDTKSEDAWNTISNLRNLIALSIGIPPYYINPTGEGAQNKAQIIKLYSRYTRKLTALQKTLADGIKDLIMIHCSKLGVNISRQNLVIKFKAITSGDSLDDTDMMVATVTGINDLYKGIDEITSSDNNNLIIDDQQFKQLFDNLTSRYLNISDLIKIADDKFEADEFDTEDNEDGFIPDDDFKHSSPSRRSPEEISTDIDNDFEAAGISASNDRAYDDYVNASDNIEIEGPQEITTEV